MGFICILLPLKYSFYYPIFCLIILFLGYWKQMDLNSMEQLLSNFQFKQLTNIRNIKDRLVKYIKWSYTTRFKLIGPMVIYIPIKIERDTLLNSVGIKDPP